MLISKQQLLFICKYLIFAEHLNILQRLIPFLHSLRLLWMYINNEAIHVTYDMHQWGPKASAPQVKSYSAFILPQCKGLCESFQGALCCWVAFGRLRPGSHWQQGPGAPWFGWHLSAYDFPADEMSKSVDTRREEQVLTSDPQPSGTFSYFVQLKNHL